MEVDIPADGIENGGESTGEILGFEPLELSNKYNTLTPGATYRTSGFLHEISDPASFVNPSNRESLAFGGHSGGQGYSNQAPNLPHGGLVRAIAGEERARRGSTVFDMPINQTVDAASALTFYRVPPTDSDEFTEFWPKLDTDNRYLDPQNSELHSPNAMNPEPLSPRPRLHTGLTGDVQGHSRYGRVNDLGPNISDNTRSAASIPLLRKIVTPVVSWVKDSDGAARYEEYYRSGRHENLSNRWESTSGVSGESKDRRHSPESRNEIVPVGYHDRPESRRNTETHSISQSDSAVILGGNFDLPYGEMPTSAGARPTSNLSNFLTGLWRPSSTGAGEKDGKRKQHRKQNAMFDPPNELEWRQSNGRGFNNYRLSSNTRNESYSSPRIEKKDDSSPDSALAYGSEKLGVQIEAAAGLIGEIIEPAHETVQLAEDSQQRLHRKSMSIDRRDDSDTSSEYYRSERNPERFRPRVLISERYRPESHSERYRPEIHYRPEMHSEHYRPESHSEHYRPESHESHAENYRPESHESHAENYRTKSHSDHYRPEIHTQNNGTESHSDHNRAEIHSDYYRTKRRSEHRKSKRHSSWSENPNETGGDTRLGFDDRISSNSIERDRRPFQARSKIQRENRYDSLVGINTEGSMSANNRVGPANGVTSEIEGLSRMPIVAYENTETDTSSRLDDFNYEKKVDETTQYRESLTGNAESENEWSYNLTSTQSDPAHPVALTGEQGFQSIKPKRHGLFALFDGRADITSDERNFAVMRRSESDVSTEQEKNNYTRPRQSSQDRASSFSQDSGIATSLAHTHNDVGFDVAPTQESDDLAEVEELINKGNSLDEMNGMGSTLLHKAAKAGRLKVVELLLNSGAMVEPFDQDSRIPLYYAAKLNHEDTVSLLVASRTKGTTNNDALEGAAKNGNVKILQYLLSNDDFTSQDSMNNALLIAVSSGHFDHMKLLLDRGASSTGGVLHEAVGSPTRGMVAVLLEYGADVNELDSKQLTAIHYAIKGKDKALVRLLLEAGADIEVRDGRGRTPLFEAVERSDRSMVKYLLRHGAEPQVVIEPGGRTLLHEAVETDNHLIVNDLLNAGANPDAVDESLQTPKDLAKRYGFVEQLFLSYGSAELNTKSIFLSSSFLTEKRDFIQGSTCLLSQGHASLENIIIDIIASPASSENLGENSSVHSFAWHFLTSIDKTPGVLNCLGVLKDAQQFSFLFLVPSDLSNPQGMRYLLSQSRPPLANVVQLAQGLVSSLISLHTAGLIHDNISPETILIFSKENSSALSPFLLGFENLQPARDAKNRRRTIDTRNLYTHPTLLSETRQASSYLTQHDIYSLGVCLLEIGLWTSFFPLDNKVEPNADDLRTKQPPNVKEMLVEMADTLLCNHTGAVYAKIVKECLTANDHLQKLTPGSETRSQDNAEKTKRLLKRFQRRFDAMSLSL